MSAWFYAVWAAKSFCYIILLSLTVSYFVEDFFNNYIPFYIVNSTVEQLSSVLCYVLLPGIMLYSKPWELTVLQIMKENRSC